MQAARATRLTWVKQTSTGLWTERTDVAFYVSQARFSAEAFGRAVRAQSAIGNRNHHVRDVILGEDYSRIRTRIELFPRFCSFAPHILRAYGVSNIAGGRYANAPNADNLITYAQRS